METMKEIAVNVNGKGAMQMVTTLYPMKDGQVPAGRDVVFTTGEDGLLYVTDLTTESSVYESEVCEGFVPTFAVTPEQRHILIVSDDDNTVASYSFPPNCQLHQLLRRSTVSIRQITCSKTFVVIVDEEPVVRILMRCNTEQVILAEGATGIIKSVVLDPQEKYLCVSSEDTTVRIFALDAEHQRATVAKSFKIKHKDIRNDDVLLHCAWQPGLTGKLLAVPVDQGILELFERDSWISKGRLMLPIGKSIASDLDIVDFSPNGQYVAAITCAKEVFIWELKTQRVLRSFRIDYPALGLQFAPQNNALVLYHTGGKLAFVKEVIPAGYTPPQHLVGEFSAAMPSIQSSSKKVQVSSYVEDEAVENRKHEKNNDEFDDFDDENEARVEAIKASFGFGTAAKDLQNPDESITLLTTKDTTSNQSFNALSRTIMEPFQPGSALNNSGNSAPSLLAWTLEGEIEVLRGASMSENLVKVEFLDKSRRGFKFNDNYMFSMACLGQYGALFAVARRVREEWEDLETGSSESDVISSHVFYRPFDSWASNSSWHKTLPEGEDAECVAAGRDFCAVATSLHTLRIYTSSGMDYTMWRLPGRVVTMTAKESLLAVVYQGLDGEMLYQLVRIQIDSSRQRVVVISKGTVPMTPPPRDVFASQHESNLIRQDAKNWAKLTWLGFDDREILYAVDSFACLQAISSSTGWNWFPIGCVGNALQKKPEDRHGIFTLGLVNDSLLYFPLEKGANCPKLRGSHRPVPSTFPFRTASFPKTLKETKEAGNGHMWQHVRLCGLESIANELNIDSISNEIVNEQAEMDKALILMMKTACTNDEPARVLDLAKCLHLEKSHQIAQKLAIHFSLRQLQSQLYNLYRVKFENPRKEKETSLLSSPPRRPLRFDGRKREESDQREMEPLCRSRSSLSRPLSAQLRDEIQAIDDVSIPVETAPGIVNKDVNVSDDSAKRSVAPANPFLKKAGSVSVSPSGKGTGLQRLAKFASPPPVKKPRRSTWKK